MSPVAANYHAQLLKLPFFDGAHAAIAAQAQTWAAAATLAGGESPGGESPGGEAHPSAGADVDARCRALVAALGGAGLTRYCVRREFGGALPDFDARAICLIRETLAYHDGLADFAFAMQGLGSGAISLAGDPVLQSRYLPEVAQGRAIAAFALSEPEAGSDVAAMSCRAERHGDHYLLDGTKTWISNGGIADFYCVFARTRPGEVRADGTTGAQGISAFVVEATDPGLSIARRIEVNAPHPLAELKFSRCRIPAQRLIGAEGEGFKIAMRTLDVFRASVAAAATGFARRAFDEALAHARARRMFGKVLADFQLTQAALADMATAIDAAALLTYRAAWLRDTGRPVTVAAAMAKMTATESAQAVIDRALQMFGGRGVERGEAVERLYREIRSLRIYEGATEVQKLIIGREVLR
jgi:acyl-CoA dehydrogenase